MKETTIQTPRGLLGQKYQVSVKHDAGIVRLVVWARSAEQAKQTVIWAEGCLDRSITGVKVLTPREQVLQDYNVSNGRIVSPGKFEGEPIFAPYYWNQALEGMADEDDGEAYTFDLGPDDAAMWPELKEQNWDSTLMLRETEQGFVICF